MMHLAAFYSSVDPAGVLTALAGVNDQVLNVSGNNVRIPPGMNFVAGAACTAVAGTAFLGGQIQAPSLRDMWYPDIGMIDVGIGWDQVISPVMWYGDNAFELVPAEDMNFFINTNPAAAEATYGLVWLSDGAPQPVQGDIKTVRCTASITQVAGSWVNGALTFTQTLPYGDYQVVGLRAAGTATVAVRLVFPGGIWRPGTVGLDGATLTGLPQLMQGAAGDLGVFNTNVPPSVDVMGSAGATTFNIWLDLIKVG